MGRLSSEAPTAPAQSCAACPWSCPCDPQSCQVFKIRRGSHCLQPLFLLPDSSHPEASLVVALVSPRTAVLLLDSAAACALLDRRACSGTTTQSSAVPGLPGPRQGWELTSLSSLKTVSHNEYLKQGPHGLVTTATWGCNTGLRTAHPPFYPPTLSHAAAHTSGRFHLPIYLFALPLCQAIRVSHLRSDCVEGSSGWSRSSVAPWPTWLVAYLEANL